MSSNRITSIAAIIIAVGYLFLTTKIQTTVFGDLIGPKSFPLLCGFGLLISGMVLFIYDSLILKETPLETANPSKSKIGLLKSPLIVTTIIGIVYALIFEPAGYPIATFIFVMLLMTYLQKKRWLANMIFSALFSVGSYLLFVKILNLSFPLGILA